MSIIRVDEAPGCHPGTAGPDHHFFVPTDRHDYREALREALGELIEDILLHADAARLSEIPCLLSLSPGPDDGDVDIIIYP